VLIGETSDAIRATSGATVARCAGMNESAEPTFEISERIAERENRKPSYAATGATSLPTRATFVTTAAT